MHRRQVVAGAALVGLIHARTASGQWKKLLDQTLGGGAAAGLGNDEVVAGLKEALAQGAQSAVGALGRHDGFLGNTAVRIPLPDSLAGPARLLDTLGQGRYATELVQTMNRAAESAVPEAGPILADAIRQMSVQDARSILDGADDAATQYFRRVGEERLTGRLRPIVSDATSRAGVTSAYKQVLDRAGPAASLVSPNAVDLDGYVTGKALDGLFLMIAAEEKRIRENPAARGTELLQKVFGGAR